MKDMIRFPRIREKKFSLLLDLVQVSKIGGCQFALFLWRRLAARFERAVDRLAN